MRKGGSTGKPLKKIPEFRSEDEERDVPYQSLIKVWLAEKVGNPFNARRKN